MVRLALSYSSAVSSDLQLLAEGLPAGVLVAAGDRVGEDATGRRDRSRRSGRASAARPAVAGRCSRSIGLSVRMAARCRGPWPSRRWRWRVVSCGAFHGVVSFSALPAPQPGPDGTDDESAPGRSEPASGPVKRAMGWGPLFPLDRSGGRITVPSSMAPGGGGGGADAAGEATGWAGVASGEKVTAAGRSGRRDWPGRGGCRLRGRRVSADEAIAASRESGVRLVRSSDSGGKRAWRSSIASSRASLAIWAGSRSGLARRNSVYPVLVAGFQGGWRSRSSVASSVRSPAAAGAGPGTDPGAVPGRSSCNASRFSPGRGVAASRGPSVPPVPGKPRQERGGACHG